MIMRDVMVRRGKNYHFLSLVLKVPRQCPPFLPVEVSSRKGEDLGSEKVKF
jgi:hypothetical protein